MRDTWQVLWEGADGSVWDLLDRRSGVQALSLAGLGLPGFVQQFAETGARDGRRYEGTRWGANIMSMTVTVGDSRHYAGRRRTGDDWRALDRAFRRSLSPEVTGSLVVITGAGRRSLSLRLDQPFGPPAGRNPASIGEATYTLELTADDQPWWEGEEVSETFVWSPPSAQPFFGGTAGTVLLYISKASSTEVAAITNPGDRAAWPRWWARGPFAGVTVGIADRTVTLPFGAAAGEFVYVDSKDQTITDENGASLWSLMGFTDPTFAPVPPGESVKLTITIDGPAAGAAVGVGLVPLHEGPW